jgi:8-oxo-dGTP diphosphatase
MILVQVGESFESCAKRELAEETGISSVTEAKVIPFTSNDIMPADGLHYVTVFVSLTVAADSSAALLENSHRDWRWIAIDQIPGPRFSPFQALLDSGVLGNKSMN